MWEDAGLNLNSLWCTFFVLRCQASAKQASTAVSGLPLHRKMLFAQGQWGMLSATLVHLHCSQCIRTMMGTSCLPGDMDYQGVRAEGEDEANRISITWNSYEVQLDTSIFVYWREHSFPQTLLYFSYSCTVDEDLVSLNQRQCYWATCA